MAKKLLIVNKNDINLENLVGKEVETFSFNGIDKNPGNRLGKKIRKLMDRNKPYLAVYLQAKAKNANFAVIEEKDEKSVKGILYLDPKINHCNPNGLVEGNYSIDTTNKRYSLLKKS